MSPRYRIPPGNTDLDPLLLDPTRLGIVSLLTGAVWCEFAFVRDSVQLTDPALSKQVATLSKAGYVEVHKGSVGRAPRTWLRATQRGSARLEQHLSALQAIVAQARTAAGSHRPEEPPGSLG
ncbi:transcriptional regulator [Actinoplanes sp. NPDC049548]|uniref:winged helix-turn-helix domain-containing protein n=1 Tax=Actinoplanes sp. NPDC049548 TaxID=3155152 RepID=UPI003414AD8B